MAVNGVRGGAMGSTAFYTLYEHKMRLLRIRDGLSCKIIERKKVIAMILSAFENLLRAGLV